MLPTSASMFAISKKMLLNSVAWTNKLIVNFNDVCVNSYTFSFRQVYFCRTKDVQTCKWLIHRSRWQRKKSESQCATLCVFYVPVNRKNEGLLKHKIRLKCLHSGEHPFLRPNIALTSAQLSNIHIRCVCVHLYGQDYTRI